MKHCPNCGHQLVSNQPLTAKQSELYRHLLNYIANNGNAPSFDEIAEKFGYSSLATVHEHLKNLEAKGYVARAFNHARSIVCLVSDEELGAKPKPDEDFDP
jgi:repressor LexA